MAYVSQRTITRPANTTAYTALDVVGGAVEFIGLPTDPAGIHDILITSADLRIDVSAVPAGMANMRLHLYSETPPSAIADNAAFDIPSGDRASYLGYIDLGTPSDQGATLFTQADQVNKQVRAGAAGLFGYIQTIGAFTPAGNSEVYAIRLYAVQL